MRDEFIEDRIYDIEHGHYSTNKERARAANELANLFRKQGMNENDIETELMGFYEVHWTDEDWADYYGCDVADIQDCMDDDIGYLD